VRVFLRLCLCLTPLFPSHFRVLAVPAVFNFSNLCPDLLDAYAIAHVVASTEHPITNHNANVGTTVKFTDWMGPTRPLNPALRPKSKGAAVKRPAENYERIRGWEQQRTSLYRWSGSGGCGSS